MLFRSTFLENEMNKLTVEEVQKEYDRLLAEGNDMVMEVVPPDVEQGADPLPGLDNDAPKPPTEAGGKDDQAPVPPPTQEAEATEGEAKNALYGLATELNAAKGSLGGGTKAVLVNSTPTGADCDAVGKLLMHGDKLYTCTTAGSAPILQKTCPVGQMLDSFGTCTAPVITDVTDNDATVCTNAGGTWDSGKKTCSPVLNCWAAGFCKAADEWWLEGTPNARVGPATRAQCAAAGEDRAWLDGYFEIRYAPAGNRSVLRNLVRYSVCE